MSVKQNVSVLMRSNKKANIIIRIIARKLNIFI